MNAERLEARLPYYERRDSNCAQFSPGCTADFSPGCKCLCNTECPSSIRCSRTRYSGRPGRRSRRPSHTGSQSSAEINFFCPRIPLGRLFSFPCDFCISREATIPRRDSVVIRESGLRHRGRSFPAPIPQPCPPPFRESIREYGGRRPVQDETSQPASCHGAPARDRFLPWQSL